MHSIVRIAILLPSLAILGCDDVGQVGGPGPDGAPQELAELSVEELSELTDSRISALGDDYTKADFSNYDAVISAHGPAYKRRLIKRIKESDRITITEHSDRMDFVDDSGHLPEEFPFHEYRRVTLTEAQRSDFAVTVEAMVGDTESATSACIFEPHHRLEFIGDDESASTMSICFRCGQVRWDEVNLVHPEGLFEALYFLIEQVGLDPDRDWKTLAKQRSEEGAVEEPVAPRRAGD